MKVLQEITEISDKHCKGCAVKRAIVKEHGHSLADNYCIKLCKVGKQIQKLGEKLETEIRVAADLTEEVYEALRRQGLIDKQICEMYDIGIQTLQRRKKTWNVPTTKRELFTVEDYWKMKDKNYNDKEIAKAWRIGNNTIRRWKKEWGIFYTRRSS